LSDCAQITSAIDCKDGDSLENESAPLLKQVEVHRLPSSGTSGSSTNATLNQGGDYQGQMLKYVL